MLICGAVDVHRLAAQVAQAERELLVRLDDHPQVVAGTPGVALELDVGEVGADRHGAAHRGRADEIQLGEGQAAGQRLDGEVGPLPQLDVEVGRVDAEAHRHVVVQLRGDRRLDVDALHDALVAERAALRRHRPVGREPVRGHDPHAEGVSLGERHRQVDVGHRVEVFVQAAHRALHRRRRGVGEVAPRRDQHGPERHDLAVVDQGGRVEEDPRAVVAGVGNPGAAAAGHARALFVDAKSLGVHRRGAHDAQQCAEHTNSKKSIHRCSSSTSGELS